MYLDRSLEVFINKYDINHQTTTHPQGYFHAKTSLYI